MKTTELEYQLEIAFQDDDSATESVAAARAELDALIAVSDSVDKLVRHLINWSIVKSDDMRNEDAADAAIAEIKRQNLEIAEMAARIAELETVLEQYADESNWGPRYSDESYPDWDLWLPGESGYEIAQKVLKSGSHD
jgi:hypothetical protein